MKEYIERDKVLAILECKLPDTDDLSLAMNGALGITAANIRRIPAADVKCVIHSEWEITDIDHACGRKCYHCPECEHDEWRYEETNYCPNCGADMRGDPDADHHN